MKLFLTLNEFLNDSHNLNEMHDPQLSDLEKILLYQGTSGERWEWRIKGTKINHHPTEPSIQRKNGDLEWFWMGKKHRWDGPALFQGGLHYYFIHGKNLNKDQWKNHPERIKWIRRNLKSLSTDFLIKDPWSGKTIDTLRNIDIIDVPKEKDLEMIHLNKGKGLFFELIRWVIKGTNKGHHPTQPAVQYKNGHWIWHWMGKEHRLDGPSSYFDGEYYYSIYGESLTKNQWRKHPKRIKWLMENASELSPTHSYKDYWTGKNIDTKRDLST